MGVAAGAMVVGGWIYFIDVVRFSPFAGVNIRSAKAGDAKAVRVLKCHKHLSENITSLSPQ